MRFERKHLDQLKAPIIALLVAVSAGLATVTWTSAKVESAHNALTSQENQLREARTRFQRSGDEREMIVRYAKPYHELEARGLIGPEQRINWLDALRLANQQAQLSGAEYQIASQQPYPFAQELNAPKLGLAQSIMRLSLKLAHEGELARFLHALENQNVGVFEVNQCLLNRSGNALVPAGHGQPNLNVECELAWITINPETAGRKP